MGGRATHTYLLHGLRVRSEVPVDASVVSSEDHDVEVQWGPQGSVPDDAPHGHVVALREDDVRRWYVATADDDGYTLRVPGHCDFAIDRALSTVDCRPDPTVAPELVGILLAGVVSAFLLDLRGELVLHASAIERDGAALAFAADSGMGKSTLAALMCAAGARLVADDVLRIDVRDPIAAVAGARRLRMRAGAQAVLDAFTTPPPSNTTVDDRTAIALAAVDPGTTIPLGAIVVPSPNRAHARLELHRFRGAEAVLLLARLTRVQGWTEPTVLGRQLDGLTRVAGAVPVFGASVPWGPPFDTRVVAALLELVEGART